MAAGTGGVKRDPVGDEGGPDVWVVLRMSDRNKAHRVGYWK
jgi:hypothetical protein